VPFLLSFSTNTTENMTTTTTINSTAEFDQFLNQIKSNKEVATKIESLTLADSIQLSSYKIAELRTLLPNLRDFNYKEDDSEEEEGEEDEHGDCRCHRHDRHE
jgi:hypothetical protein